MLLKNRKTTPQEQPSDNALQMIADLARENGQLQAENDELKNKLARAESKMAAYAAAAAG